jgi:hypothetical protein
MTTNANPSPTDISDALANALANENRRRCPRINVTHARCKVFVSYPELGQIKYPVHTLGEYGAKFATTNPKVSSLRGYEVQSTIHLGPFKLDLRSKMVYNDAHFAAVEFLDRDQQLRQLMSELFQLELTAISLSPFQNFSSAAGGSTCSTTYSDNHGNIVEVFTDREGLSALRGQIQPLDLKFVWTHSSRGEFRMSTVAGQPVNPREYRDQIFTVLNNLMGLHPTLHQAALETISAGIPSN